MSDLAQGLQPPRLPCEALPLRGSACHERRPQSLREDAPRHTTPATSPPRGCGVSGSAVALHVRPSQERSEPEQPTTRPTTKPARHASRQPNFRAKVDKVRSRSEEIRRG